MRSAAAGPRTAISTRPWGSCSRRWATSTGGPSWGCPVWAASSTQTPADEPLDKLTLSNEHLLEAVRHLARVRDAGSGRWRTVDYRHLGAEELGSIYESLLELVPRHSAVDRSFELVEAAGNARKTTGSYYTPSSLIELLLDSALDPVIDDAVKRGEQAAAGAPDPSEAIVGELLALTVCDPACGSGHFLVAAARRIAKRVAAVREGNPEPTLPSVRAALHEVIARCIYAVDLNPMAVDLAKVSLWLEALEPGKPLSFLDAHIKCGNGLVGATPALLRAGIPDKAFKPIEGDDDSYARSLARLNEEERSGQIGLFDLSAEAKVANAAFAAELQDIVSAPAATLADIRVQAKSYASWESLPEYRHARHVADAWCAAILWHKSQDAPQPITHDVFRGLEDPDGSAASRATHAEIARLAAEFRFFHWHLAFPDIFAVPENAAGADLETGWTGGFSCVVANPPWDKVDFEDQKYFSVVEPAIAKLAGAARRARVTTWIDEYPEEGQRYLTTRRAVKARFHFAADSGAFPLCGRGLTVKGVNSLQTDHLFTERFLTITSPTGRVGCVVPSTIATGAGAQHLFADITRRGAVSVLYDFENRKPLFPGVDSRYNFCILVLVGREGRERDARFAFFLSDVDELGPERLFALSPEEIALINPNTGSLPIFRSRHDADLTVAIHHRVPVLWDDTKSNGNRWKITFKNHFNMTDDSDVFRAREQLESAGWRLDGNVFTHGDKRMLPLYEGKMVHHFDHRYGSYYGTGNEDRRHLDVAEKQDPSQTADPRYWVLDDGVIPVVRRGSNVEVAGVALRLSALHWDREWLCGWRDVCRTTDERTAIPAFLPRAAVGHTFPLMLPRVSPRLVTALIAAQSSLVFDYVGRQKVGGIHMALMTWKQLPVPAPEKLEPHTPFITPRVLELVYTAYDMSGLARDLGDSGCPFRWDVDRRSSIRAELDAYFFHLYGVSRDDADYIVETFQSDSGGGLKNNEIAKYGTYRTKNLVLAEYDRMAVDGCGLDSPLIDGQNFTSTLTPPPGHGPRHPARPKS